MPMLPNQAEKKQHEHAPQPALDAAGWAAHALIRNNMA